MMTHTSMPPRDSRKRLLRRRAPIVWIDAGLRLLALIILLLVGWTTGAAGNSSAGAPSAEIALQPSVPGKPMTPMSRGAI